MTEEAFIFMHQQSSGIVNPRTKLSINVTAAEPSPTGVVTSMVLGRNALSINGN